MACCGFQRGIHNKLTETTNLTNNPVCKSQSRTPWMACLNEKFLHM